MAAKKPDPSGPRSRRSAHRAKPSKVSAVANSDGTTDQAVVPDAHPRRGNEFPVVGVGASAGGLEAVSELLASLPPDAPMALVLVQHLDPKHASLLTELLARTTPLRVVEVRPGTRVEPAHVYVIPPNSTMTISSGTLQLGPRASGSGPHMPIDVFLRSLAEDCGDRAIGVVLSGTASDGALGIKAIKGEGGVTFAQDPATAGHDGMPRSAIASGAVDFVLSPELIGRELTRIGRHPYVRQTATPTVATAPAEEPALEQIYRMLQQDSGVDFRLYRQTTIRRRIARRMLVHKIDTVQEYQRLLEDNGAELQMLYHEVLINVTRFFRDPEVFDALQQAVLSRLGSHKADQPLRVWVPGCATGEEVYSIAMVLLEATDRSRIPLQIFGSDVSEAAIVRARAGVYPTNIEIDVSPERLRRFFSKSDGQYQVKKSVRELCIFARHDLSKDPPFSSVDVVSCRNVLIYFDAAVQRRIMATFHYALRNGGVLLLGGAESVGPLAEQFTALDKKARLYGKKPTSTRFTLGPAPFDRGGPSPDHARIDRREEAIPRVDLQREIDRILVGRYAPAGVLVNEAYEILQFRGQTSPYLEPAPGHASLNIMKMARQGLLMELRAALVAARKRGKPVRREGLHIKENGGFTNVNLEVIPVRTLADESNYLVLFEKASVARPAKTAMRRAASRTAPEREIDRLQEELAATKDFLQSIIEDREATNEELRSANEELQSSNEELQSTNEELETAKEELQSVNEELMTVNEELQHRNSELGQLNNDLNNVIASVNIPIVILGNDLRVRRFTPMAAKAFNLLPADIGRPIAATRGTVEIPDLAPLCAEVVETVAPTTREVRDREGGWYSLSVRPYRTSENVIDGAVLILIDISAVKTSLEQVAAARDFSEAVVDTVRTPLVILDVDLRVRSANRAFYETFHASAGETVNRKLTDLGNRQWDIEALRRAMTELVEHGTSLEDFEVEHDFPAVGPRVVLVNARLIHRDIEPMRTILLAMEDITPRRRAERELRASEELRYRRLFETATDGIVLIDANTGQITNVNPAWTSLTGRAAADILGHRPWEVGSFENPETMRAIVRQVQERDFVRYEDVRISRADGSIRHVELACNGYRLSGRRVIQCIARDITERVQLLERERAARAEAEAANRAKDDFLSVLSHELRTPLTAMLGWVRVLRQRALDPVKTGEALETVERNTRLLGQLIEDLLDVSRIAAGKLAIEVRPVDLAIVVRGAVETVRQSADAKGVALAVHVPERAPTVRGDRYRLQQVVWNLLSNAVKFTPKGGRIDLRLEEIPGGARITVSDTGHGISPLFLPRIFDRFRQAESIATRTQGGLGLGLAIVRHLVELHGGRVAVSSAGEGQGATFVIELPHGTPVPEEREHEPSGREDTDGAAADVRLDGLRVLVVEDDLDTSRMLAQSLGDRGADVITVETAAAAVAALDQGMVHVVVSDIGLPGEDGYELIRRVRATPARTGGRVPGIALTAFAREEDVQRAIAAGFDVHLAKPIEPSQLARTILRLLEGASGTTTA